MATTQQYFKDTHGHVFVYNPQLHAERIGNGYEFVSSPFEPKPEIKLAKQEQKPKDKSVALGE
jgi:hypothetical protein